MNTGNQEMKKMAEIKSTKEEKEKTYTRSEFDWTIHSDWSKEPFGF